MQQRGLVTRAECSEDGRGAFVVITDKGLQAIKDAAPGHVDSVRRNLIDVLSPDQLKALTDVSDTVIANFGESCPERHAAGESQSENRSPVSRS
jgi:DNA-binding MarR family transcriptional regulator